MRTDRTTLAANSSYNLLRDIPSASAASGTVSRILFIASSPLLFSDGAGQLLTGNAPVLAGTGGGRQREDRVSGGAPAALGPFEIGECNHGLVAAVVRGKAVLARFPGPAGGAKRPHGGGVVAAFGGEVAAVAEHVSPAAQRLEVGAWVVAELPGSEDKPALVASRVAVEAQVFLGDAHGQRTDRLGGLSGVFGQVGGDRGVGDLAIAGEPDDTGIDLGAPGDVPAFRLGRVRDGGEPGNTCDPANDVGQHLGGEGRVGRDGPCGVDRVEAVEAEDGVEVD